MTWWPKLYVLNPFVNKDMQHADGKEMQEINFFLSAYH